MFLMAFSASSLFELSRNGLTTWLRKNRRYVGVSFAVSHFIHLALIAMVAVEYPEPFFATRGAFEFVGGGLVYAIILAMTITSFDGPTRKLGTKWWTRLHLFGGIAIWFTFTQRYVRSSFADPSYLVAVIPLLVAGLLKLRYYRQAGPEGQSEAFEALSWAVISSRSNPRISAIFLAILVLSCRPLNMSEPGPKA